MKLFKVLPFIIGFICPLYLAAQTFQQNDEKPIRLQFPLIEYPYLSYASQTVSAPDDPVFTDYLKMFANPSMSQSLALSNDLYLTTHYGIKRLFHEQDTFKRILFSSLTAAGADLLLLYAPLGNGWLHEEYHRSVMTLFYINSFNDMNTFPIGKRTVSVNSIDDAELASMKLHSNPDFVRLMSAGIEAQYDQIQEMQKANFYNDQDLPNLSLYWISTVNSIFYVNSCADSSANQLTDEIMLEEGSNTEVRDFTGLDLAAWTYDLFNPDEPYAERGIHPSGVGIKRYIKPADLTQEQLDYLKKQGGLQFLNLLSPALYSFYRIRLRSDSSGTYYGNFAIRHILTSFGSDISTNIMLQTPLRNFFFAYHLYQNYNHSFHGLEIEVIDEQIVVKNKTLLLSPGLMIWSQPEDQSFTTSKSAIGGLATLTANYPITRALYFQLSMTAKTPGWAMGNMYLDANYTVSSGIALQFGND